MKVENVNGGATLVLVLLILLGVSLGCMGSGGGAEKCLGTVSHDDKTYKPELPADNKKQAELNACNLYCLETDKEFEGMYKVWLETPGARKIAERKKRTPTKQEALMDDKRLLDYVTLNCAKRCVEGANKGRHSLEVKCGK